MIFEKRSGNDINLTHFLHVYWSLTDRLKSSEPVMPYTVLKCRLDYKFTTFFISVKSPEHCMWMSLTEIEQALQQQRITILEFWS